MTRHGSCSPDLDVAALRLELGEGLLQLLIGHLVLEPTRLGKLNQLQLQLFRKFRFHHANVRQPLPRLWCEYLSQNGLFLPLHLLLLGGSTLLVQTSSLVLSQSPSP